MGPSEIFGLPESNLSCLMIGFCILGLANPISSTIGIPEASEVLEI